MIRNIDIRLNAAHPELPLVEATTYAGAPSSVFVRGVPAQCGAWRITGVKVAVTYPDGNAATRSAVESCGGVWVATIPAAESDGRTEKGFAILADGVDENGDAVTGYVLGVADFSVCALLPVPVPTPGGIAYALKLFDEKPSVPRRGDVAPGDAGLEWYDGESWRPFMDLADYYTKTETDEAIDKIAAYYITADAQGNPFASRAALVGAQTYYSGGAVRVPTRNDYAVVSADETHGGAEWRYIYAVDAQGAGQWEPQYAVEGVVAYDDAVTRTSANGVKSSGIWSALWGALAAAPGTSIYDWSRVAMRYDYNEDVRPSGNVFTVADRTISYIAPDGAAAISIAFPPAMAGKVRDFAVVIGLGSGESAPEISLPSSITFVNGEGEMPAIEDGVETVLYFTEIYSYCFLVKGEKLAPIE